MALERELALVQTDLGNVEVDRRKERRERTKLKTDLRRALGEDEMTEQVKLIFAHFNSRLGRGLKWRPFSRNDELVRKALRCADTTEQAAALCFEAIDGLAVRPYVVERGGKPQRAESGEERQRFDKLEHCLRDEDTIRRFAGYARQAREGDERIPSREPVVSRSLFEEAVQEAAKYRQTCELLKAMVAVQDSYVRRLESELGVVAA